MDEIMMGAAPMTEEAEMPMEAVKAIGSEELLEFTRILQKYKAGKAHTEQRIVASENWWKLRNTAEEKSSTAIGADGGYTSKSGWLHNVIVSKHADAIEAYPEPIVLPREASDKGEAQILSAILPCVLEQNKFEKTYDHAMWQKLKTGTGAYKVVWDAGKLNGLGDISIEKVNLLNVFWEPGVSDIQKSRYFFHTELQDKDVLEERYPMLKDKLKGTGFLATKFLYDDNVSTENKATVIEVYYHKHMGGRKTLQYVKYVNDTVIFATENEEGMAERGLYDHALYPYVFDTLFPIEGSPCGYGFVDICRSPQTAIDLLNTNFVKNAAAGSAPRYFARIDGAVNEEEFLDTSKPIVHVNGNLGEDSLRQINFNALPGVYVNVLDRTIQELRETTGNTETAAGKVASGVTAASAIAALQEASGKGSKASTKASYMAFGEIIEMCIELIRQFYELPRQFRIVGEMGKEHFISYDNRGIQPQHQGVDFGQDMGFRLPVFDVKVSAQRRTVYTKVTQNELALQFFQMGFFNPQMADQALMCLGMMDFDGKEETMQKISKQATMQQMLIQYMQLALTFAQTYRPDMVPGISNDIMRAMGGAAPAMPSAPINLEQTDNIAGTGKKEPAIVENARARASEAGQPTSGRVTGGAG